MESRCVNVLCGVMVAGVDRRAQTQRGGGGHLQQGFRPGPGDSARMLGSSLRKVMLI